MTDMTKYLFVMYNSKKKRTHWWEDVMFMLELMPTDPDSVRGKIVWINSAVTSWKLAEIVTFSSKIVGPLKRHPSEEEFLELVLP